MISSMGRSGFVISPLIENTDDFAALFDTSVELKRKYVKSVQITPAGGDSIIWKDRFTLRLSELVLPDRHTSPPLDPIAE